MYRSHADVFLDVFDNNIFVDMIALYHKDKAYIEYYDGVGINIRRFKKQSANDKGFVGTGSGLLFDYGIS